MYERAMGQRFCALALPLQRFHRLSGRHRLQGWVSTEAPATPLAKLMALLLGTPLRAGSGPIRFELDACTDHEIWTRHFPSQHMASTLSLQDGVLVEQLGAARLSFQLAEHEGRLVMRLQGLRFLGLPCPRRWLPAIVAEECGSESGPGDQGNNGNQDKLHFRVEATLPWIGRVAGYRGHLDLPAQEALPS
jgi:Domain of unknown function (DUF4166)